MLIILNAFQTLVSSPVRHQKPSSCFLYPVATYILWDLSERGQSLFMRVVTKIDRLAAPWQLYHVNYKRKDLLVKQKYPFSVSSVSWSNVYLKWVLYSPTWEYNNLCCSRCWLVAVYQSYQVPEMSVWLSVGRKKLNYMIILYFVLWDNTKSKYWFSSNEKICRFYSLCWPNSDAHYSK